MVWLGLGLCLWPRVRGRVRLEPRVRVRVKNTEKTSKNAV